MLDVLIVQPTTTAFRSEAYVNVGQHSANVPHYFFGLFADKALAYTSVRPESVLVRDLGEDYRVLKPIPVKIRQVDNSFIASFEAANAHASGDTWNESVSNLQYFLMDSFDNLESHTLEKLGPAPRRQLAVLQSFLTRK